MRLAGTIRTDHRRQLISVAAISVRGLTKQFGAITAMKDLSFEVKEGSITGFLGPNGAGKTTTLRMVLGLVHATAGTALIDGVAYRRLDRPAFTVGAALEATGLHPGRTARNHLRILAVPNRIPVRRVDEVLAALDDRGGAVRLRTPAGPARWRRWRRRVPLRSPAPSGDGGGRPFHPRFTASTRGLARPIGG